VNIVDLEIVNPLTIPHWDDLILAHPEVTIFHSSFWARVLHESYGYDPVYFAAFENGALNALLPFMDVRSLLTGRRGISLPFTDYCRPIFPQAEPFHDLFSSVIQYGAKSRWATIEMRSDGVIPAEIPSSSVYYRHTLDLMKDEQRLQKGLRESTRRNIKTAEKHGVKVTRETSKDALAQFYQLNCLTRKLHGLPPQPWRFFEKLHEHLLAKGLGTVSLATYRGEIIAGAVFLSFKDRVVFKYGASDRRCQHLRANNLIMWDAIQWYASCGPKSLCLGRTELEHHGLLQFKRGWGSTEENLHYFKYDLKHSDFVRQVSSESGFHNRICRLLPLPVLRIAGALLYRHVC
jgi:hypothetical protein